MRSMLPGFLFGISLVVIATLFTLLDISEPPVYALSPEQSDTFDENYDEAIQAASKLTQIEGEDLYYNLSNPTQIFSRDGEKIFVELKPD